MGLSWKSYQNYALIVSEKYHSKVYNVPLGKITLKKIVILSKSENVGAKSKERLRKNHHNFCIILSRNPI